MPIARHLVGFVALALPILLSAQAHDPRHATPSATRDSLSLMLTALVTRVAPAINGRSRTEALLTQPMLALRGARGPLRYAVMLNAERWTMPDGEPVAGIWGEGFIDRRHPHTVLHEAMVTLERRARGVRASLSAGKGMAPFGTDDPMVRPFTKYAANHHVMQVLERAQVVGALRIGAKGALEGAVFNGDEPASPTASPTWRRFADSRSVRLTLWPTPVIELQASTASVRSPEFAGGDGLDQAKRSASLRWTPARGALQYALLEWGRTDERYRTREIIDYGTVLGELVATHRVAVIAARFEQTSRPEEERLLDPFRTARPPTDLTIKGLTRWRLSSLQLALPMPPVRARGFGSVFVEGTHARSAPLLRPVLLDPRDISGASVVWHVSAGIRLGAGAMPARVGRYGAAAGGAATNAMFMARHDHRRTTGGR